MSKPVTIEPMLDWDAFWAAIAEMPLYRCHGAINVHLNTRLMVTQIAFAKAERNWVIVDA